MDFIVSAKLLWSRDADETDLHSSWFHSDPITYLSKQSCATTLSNGQAFTITTCLLCSGEKHSQLSDLMKWAFGQGKVCWGDVFTGETSSSGHRAVMWLSHLIRWGDPEQTDRSLWHPTTPTIPWGTHADERVYWHCVQNNCVNVDGVECETAGLQVV